MGKLIGVLLGLALLSGCATTAKDFKPSKVAIDEAAIIGRVNVLYNGKDFTEKCAICFNSVNGPCYRLDKSGVVIMKIKAGPTELRRLACVDVSEQHYHFNGATFLAPARAKTYFGDVTINWSNAGGFKVSTMFGLVGALVDQSSNDGAARMRVTSEPNGVLASYKDLVGSQDDLTYRQNIVTEGR